MEQLKELGQIWTCVYSSSIENWYEKLDKRLKLKHWNFVSSNPVIFIGMYHWGDYLRLYWQSLFIQKRRIFWCGSDILNLEKNNVGRFIVTTILNTFLTEHFCENEVERYKLFTLGLDATIIPMIFDDPNNFHPTFKLADKTHVWMSTHPGRELEYGVDIIAKIAPQLPDVQFHIFGELTQHYRSMLYWNQNVIFEGKVSEERFNYLISYYHSSLRINAFDGFSEVTAKSILLGQYPITLIPYQGIDFYMSEHQLVILIEDLKNKKISNPQQAFWRTRLEQSLKQLTT